MLSTIWILAQFSPVIKAVSSWAYATLPVLAIILSMAVLLQVR